MQPFHWVFTNSAQRKLGKLVFRVERVSPSHVCSEPPLSTCVRHKMLERKAWITHAIGEVSRAFVGCTNTSATIWPSRNSVSERRGGRAGSEMPRAPACPGGRPSRSHRLRIGRDVVAKRLCRSQQIRAHRHHNEAETSEIGRNRRRSCHDAKQLYDDAQAGALVPAPRGEGVRKRGRRISRRLAVAIERYAGRQELTEPSRQRHLGVDDRRGADIPDHRFVGAREAETDRIGAEPAFGCTGATQGEAFDAIMLTRPRAAAISA